MDIEKIMKLMEGFIKEMTMIKADVKFTIGLSSEGDRFIVTHNYADIHEDKEYRLKMNRAYSRWFSDHDIYSISVILERDKEKMKIDYKDGFKYRIGNCSHCQHCIGISGKAGTCEVYCAKTQPPAEIPRENLTTLQIPDFCPLEEK